MIYKLIHFNDYLFVISDEDKKEDEFDYNGKKVLAHLPIDDSKPLIPNVDLLPNLPERNMLIQYIEERFLNGDEEAENIIVEGKGYNAKYSTLYDYVSKRYLEGDKYAEKLIKEISRISLPTGIYVRQRKEGDKWIADTFTNHNGKRVWAAVYKY